MRVLGGLLNAAPKQVMYIVIRALIPKQRTPSGQINVRVHGRTKTEDATSTFRVVDGEHFTQVHNCYNALNGFFLKSKDRS